MNRSILFYGTQCSFADLVLQRLLEEDVSIAARIVPGIGFPAKPFYELSSPTRRRSRMNLPLVRTSSSELPDRPESDFPTIAVNDHSATETAERISSIGADLAIVCCYPERLRPSLLETTRDGALNIHPSLLPQYRGPEPLFWIYRNGDLKTGVTIHVVEPSLDTGPIVSQHVIDLPLGKAGNELWMDSASIGAEMLIQALQSGAPDHAALTPQDHTGASYDSWPTNDDLQLDARAWDAWRVFHFVRGVAPLGYRPVVRTATASFPVSWALDYVNTDSKDVPPSESPDERWIDAADGAVLLKLDQQLIF